VNLIKEYLVSVNGAYIYAIIAMLIFLLTFIFMIYQTYSIKKEDVSHYSRLPLDEEDENQL
jgi:cbb3-type cytochrome oxidase subunit 3